MVFPPSDEFLCSDYPVADEAYNQLADEFTNVKNLKDSEFFSIEKREVLNMENLQKEKQISVDPISVKESGKPSLAMSPVTASGSPTEYGMPPLPLPPGKSRFLSYSLPGSAASSPRFSSAVLKKNSKNQAANPLAHQHSVALSRLAQLRENHLRRSKSCGEGRASAPNDEFDLWLTKANSSRYSSSFKSETRIVAQQKGRQEMLDSSEDNFKCSAMCLFLPGFGKGKPVRASRKEEQPPPEKPHVISRTVSLEKFECGSWTSSAFIYDNEDGGNSSNLFFDLPLELIQSSANDADSPVKAAFVFEKDRKGVLKNRASRGMGRKSHESSRHVRFSTSSPAPPTSPSPCITPRLRKAREDFNAFIEAQSA